MTLSNLNFRFSSGCHYTTPRSCREVGRIPEPNPSLLGKAIYESSQSHPDPALFNVMLLTSDGMLVRSIREVLALSNPVFRDLCISNITGRHGDAVFVNIPHKELRQILEFLYVDDCPSLRLARAFMKASESFPCERVKDIIKLARAAYMMKMERLVSRCSDSLQNLMIRFKHITCVIYEELSEEDFEVNWVKELGHATQCFAALFPKSTLLGKCECGLNCGILHISDEMAVAFFKEVMKQTLDDKDILPYVFQALLVWASDGTALESNLKRPAGGEFEKMVEMNKMQMSRQRVGRAKQIFKLFDLTHFKPMFLFEVVERSGLTEEGDMTKAYRRLLFLELNQQEEPAESSRMSVPCQLQIREIDDHHLL